MAKAPSLWKRETKVTQCTRSCPRVDSCGTVEMGNGEVLWMPPKWKQTLHDSWRTIKGAEPDAVKAARPVLNGGDEETCSNATRLAPTQLQRRLKLAFGNFLSRYKGPTKSVIILGRRLYTTHGLSHSTYAET